MQFVTYAPARVTAWFLIGTQVRSWERLVHAVCHVRTMIGTQVRSWATDSKRVVANFDRTMAKSQWERTLGMRVYKGGELFANCVRASILCC